VEWKWTNLLLLSVCAQCQIFKWTRCRILSKAVRDDLLGQAGEAGAMERLWNNRSEISTTRNGSAVK